MLPPSLGILALFFTEIQSLISFLLALFSGSIAPTSFEFLLRLLAHAFAKEKDDSGLVALYIRGNPSAIV